jgi:LacI family transcriptional regulator
VNKNQIQAVVLDWGVAQVEKLAATVSLNFRTGIQEAVSHLAGLGHRFIAHVSGPLNLWTARERRDAFLDAMRSLSLETYDTLLTEGNLRIEGGYQAYQVLSKAIPRPTAVITANDLTALGVLWAARNNGLSLPEDMSVIGLDDIDLASKVTPALTTIALPRFEIGKIAMQLLLDEIHDPAGVRKKQEVATRLIIRDSTTNVAKSRRKAEEDRLKINT